MKKYIVSLIALVAALNACNRGDVVPDSAKNEKVFSVVVDAPMAVKSESAVTCREMQVSAEGDRGVAVSLIESCKPVADVAYTKANTNDVIDTYNQFLKDYGSNGFELYSIDTEDLEIKSLGTMRFSSAKKGWLLSDPTKNPKTFGANVWYAGLVPDDRNVIKVSEFATFEIYCTPDVDAQENIMVGFNYAFHHSDDYYCLHFMHVTSLISFNFIADGLDSSAKLISVGLYGINSRGDIVIYGSDTAKQAPACFHADDPRNYVLTLSDEKQLSNQCIYVVPTMAYETGMADAYIKAVFEVPGHDGVVKVNAEASLADVSWSPGYKYSYTLRLHRDPINGSTEDYTGGSSYGDNLFN